MKEILQKEKDLSETVHLIGPGDIYYIKFPGLHRFMHCVIIINGCQYNILNHCSKFGPGLVSKVALGWYQYCNQCGGNNK